MLRSSLLLAAVAATLLLCTVRADVPGDLIDSLPGFGKTPSKQYSGFLPADEAKSVMLHYWFVTSTNKPETDPIVVWMNGGPGCSSIGGFLTELGPFTFTGEEDASGIPTLTENPYGWSTVSSVLFLEQPIGVGFSYATNGSTDSDDFTQSQNTYGFLLNFFAAYPEFSKNDFFITGESYAGIYVPTLANRVVDGNAAGNPYINLKGIAVGDGCIGNSVGTCGNGGDAVQIDVDFFYGHGMYSSALHEQIYATCDFKNISDKCDSLTCPGFGGQKHSALTQRLHAPAQRRLARLRDPVICLPDQLSSDFMNAAAVQKALHVDSSPTKTWSDCSGIGYNSNLVSLLPTYPKLIANMNVVIYSGDADACVPWNGSYNWTRNLGLEETVAWRPWMASDPTGREWTAGFLTSWGPNFTFVTIKHSGHFVPEYEPEAAIAMYKAFLTHTLPQ